MRVCLRALQLVGFLVLVISCKKDPEHPVTKPTEDFTRRYLFQKGSWWAYQDSVSGLTDTMLLDSTRAWKAGLAPVNNRYQIAVWGDYTHTHLGPITLEAYSSGRTMPYCFVVVGSPGTAMNLGYGLEKGPYPGMGWGLNDNIVLKDTAASLSIGSEQIQGIHVFALDSAKWQNQPRPIFKECWWAKNIGLVRYKLSTGQTYTLTARQAAPLWPLP